MKNIPIWKIIVLSIVTFGVYDIVWYIRRQREMESTYNLKMPHWLWMLAPEIIVLILAIPVFILAAAIGFTPLTIGLVIFILLLAFAAAGLNIWWLVGFSRAAAKVIANRVPTGWSVVLYMILGNFAQIVALQYYINRYAGDTLPKKSVGPSKKFKNITILLIVVTIALNILSAIIPSGDMGGNTDSAQSQQ